MAFWSLGFICIGDDGKEHGNYREYWDKIGVIFGLYIYMYVYIGIMEKKMDTAIVYWGYRGFRV